MLELTSQGLPALPPATFHFAKELRREFQKQLWHSLAPWPHPPGTLALCPVSGGLAPQEITLFMGVRKIQRWSVHPQPPNSQQ